MMFNVDDDIHELDMNYTYDGLQYRIVKLLGEKFFRLSHGKAHLCSSKRFDLIIHVIETSGKQLYKSVCSIRPMSKLRESAALSANDIAHAHNDKKLYVMFNDFMHSIICDEHVNTFEVGDIVYESNYVPFDGKIYERSNESYKLFDDVAEYGDVIAPRVLVYTPRKK